MYILWFIVIIGAMVVEAITLDLVSIWLVPGSLVALGIYYLDYPMYAQIIGCLITAILFSIMVRPMCTKYLRGSIVKTNIDELIGKKVEIVKDIKFNSHGEAKLNNAIWNAISYEDQTIEAGSIAVIKAIEGNKLVVKKI